MSEKNRVYVLTGIMFVIVCIVSVISLLKFYTYQNNMFKSALMEFAELEASYIKAAVKDGHTKDEIKKTLKNAHLPLTLLGDTAEFAIAELIDGKTMHFFIAYRGKDLTKEPVDLPYFGEKGVPMSYALAGKKGVAELTDYQGKKVLSAYVPVPELNFGVVAKINTSEYRRLVFSWVLELVATALTLIFIGAYLFIRINRSVIQTLEKNKNKFEKLSVSLDNKNKEYEQILYIATHDLRSPLVNIQGFSREIQQSLNELMKKSTDETKEIFKEISISINFITTSAAKMDSLLAGLLKFSRLGRLGVIKVEINVKNMLESIKKVFEYKLKEKKINVVIGNVPNCLADENLLNQVFSNLIDNSIKYADGLKSERFIEIKGGETSDIVWFEVKDNGVGIEERHLTKVFDIFHRVDNSVQGEGLGLSIIKKIISKHDGIVTLNSKFKEGTTFRFELPKQDIW